VTTLTQADVVQTWPPLPSSVGAARVRLRHCLRQWDLLTISDTSALVLSELATNAVRHAGTDFTVTLSRTTDGLLISVHDDAAAGPAPRAPALDELSLGGRGMHLVDAMTAGWGVVLDGYGGKSVWALITDD
jgi:anti-sigma regulatory factor (Ser/Thr protein kinase)